MKDHKSIGTLKKLFEGERAKRLIIIAGLAGLGLILASSLVDFSPSEPKGEEFSVTTYSTQIESDLQAVVSQIEGAGETKVLLTMENSVEYVYLKDSTTKTKEIQPHIRGVLVVCEGGDDPVAVERITTAVTKALDISTAKVCITKLSE
ncbi:MAG: hypothetical protein II125_03515 [Ruminococcus sp.]|nr:hypothetical protein [Ruminococcus sp.]MBQ1815495.1 hypothetical protein [Ruminococcus sp.]MEE0856237.1 hypothetical protein [Ruminococcus sp.]MEE1171077.1 hypothetical protein [Ruminococcus sp.]